MSQPGFCLSWQRPTFQFFVGATIQEKHKQSGLFSLTKKQAECFRQQQQQQQQQQQLTLVVRLHNLKKIFGGFDLNIDYVFFVAALIALNKKCVFLTTDWLDSFCIYKKTILLIERSISKMF